MAKCGFGDVKDAAAAFIGPQTSDAGSLGSDAPVQVGVGVSCGLEAAVHGVQNTVNSLGEDNSYGLLTDDFENVFSLVDRQSIPEEIAEHFPALLPWVN